MASLKRRADRLAKLGKSQWMRVVSGPRRQRLLTRADDMIGRVYIRVATAKFDHISQAPGYVHHPGDNVGVLQLDAFGEATSPLGHSSFRVHKYPSTSA